MTQSERQLNPTVLSDEHLKIVAHMVASEVKKLILEIDQPMTAKQAWAWSGWGKSKFYRFVNLGIIKGHRLDPESDPVYLKSEIISSIKRS